MVKGVVCATHWVRCGGEESVHLLLVTCTLGPLWWGKGVDLLLVTRTLGPLWQGRKC